MDCMQPQQSYFPQQTEEDEKKKLLMVIGGAVLGVILLIIMGMMIFSGDKSREILERSIAYTFEEIRTNKLVSKYDNDDFDLIQYQAQFNTLVYSDLSTLQNIFGVDEELNKDVIEALTDVEVKPRFAEAYSINKFEAEYARTMTALMNKNLNELRQLEKLSSGENKQAIRTIIHNHEALIEQIKDI